MIGASQSFGQSDVPGAEGAGVASEVAAATQARVEAMKGLPPVRGLGFSLALDANMAARSDLEDLGSFSVSRADVQLDWRTFMFRPVVVGLSAEQEWSRYDFSGAGTDFLSESFDDVYIRRFGLNLRGRLADRWGGFAAGDVTFSGAEGVSFSDGMTYGGMLGARYQLTDAVGVSMGLLGRHRLEKGFQIYPIPGVDWKINKQWALTTAQGVTLAWTPEEGGKWTFTLSGSYQSRAFRLKEDVPLSGKVLRDQRIPVLLAANYAPNPAFLFRVYAGIVAWRELEIRDNNTDEQLIDSDPVLMAGAYARIRF